MFLSSLMWQISNELQRTLWQMLVLCHDPEQLPTTTGDWSSIRLYLLEWGWLSETETPGERAWGGPEEMFCPIRLMLMRPSASVCCNAFQSNILLPSFLFVHTVMVRLYRAAEMKEIGRVVEREWVGEWYQRIYLFAHCGMNTCLYVCMCVCVFGGCTKTHLRFWLFLKSIAVVWWWGSIGSTTHPTLFHFWCWLAQRELCIIYYPPPALLAAKKTSFQEGSQGAENQPPK